VFGSTAAAVVRIKNYFKVYIFFHVDSASKLIIFLNPFKKNRYKKRRKYKIHDPPKIKKNFHL
jgi:hypothetical protein